MNSPTHKLHLPLNYVLAAARICPKDNIRENLNYVQVRVSHCGLVTLLSSDGKIAFASFLGSSFKQEDPSVYGESFFLPVDYVKMLPKARNKSSVGFDPSWKANDLQVHIKNDLDEGYSIKMFKSHKNDGDSKRGVVSITTDSYPKSLPDIAAVFKMYDFTSTSVSSVDYLPLDPALISKVTHSMSMLASGSGMAIIPARKEFNASLNPVMFQTPVYDTRNYYLVMTLLRKAAGVENFSDDVGRL